MLYLETDKDGDQVFLHADQEGIQKLREVLDSLEGQPEVPEHEHLFTPAWGGDELDEQLSIGAKDSDSGSNRTVHQVKLYYWPKSKE
jgi:hypothetical protein